MITPVRVLGQDEEGGFFSDAWDFTKRFVGSTIGPLAPVVSAVNAIEKAFDDTTEQNDVPDYVPAPEPITSIIPGGDGAGSSGGGSSGGGSKGSGGGILPGVSASMTGSAPKWPWIVGAGLVLGAGGLAWHAVSKRKHKRGRRR